MTLASSAPHDSEHSDWAVRFWLFFVAFLVFMMVVVGGATRLTDSGLSITEWKPILGVIPPLNEADWHVAFEKYQQIPEYKKINKWMDLEAFKFIYWWEWGHRFLGRFVGVAFIIPFIFFWVTGRLASTPKGRLIVFFLLGGLQGALGWYMVVSGLAERVDVSQYRLAAHLSLAVVIFAGLFWTAMTLGREAEYDLKSLHKNSVILCFLVFIQIVIGAFVAGLDAGFGYNTWPLMDGSIIPSGLFSMSPGWRNLFENALTVQFIHRMFAYVVLVFGFSYLYKVLRSSDEGAAQLSAGFLGLALLAQVGLGIWTLLAKVPVSLGVMHQGMAIVLLSVALWHLRIMSKKVQ